MNRTVILRNAEARALVQTRRVALRRAVKPPMGYIGPATIEDWRASKAHPDMPDPGRLMFFYWQDGGVYPRTVSAILCPLGVPGDVRLVRETWGDITADHPLVPDGRKPAPGDRLVYLSDPADAAQWIPGHPGCGAFCWRSPVTMPRFACRMALRVESVRVERAGDGWEWVCEGVREEVPDA